MLAIAEQKQIPVFFLYLSCTVLNWEKIPYSNNKLNYLGLSDEEPKNLSRVV